MSAKKIIYSILSILIIQSSLIALELRTAAQKSFPKYYINNNTMAGICVDIIKKIEETFPEIKFNGYQDFLPFRRLQLYLEKDQLDIFFGFKMSKVRQAKYTFLEIPLYQVNYVLAVKYDDKIKITSLKDITSLDKNETIMTVFGSATNRFLKKEGDFNIDDGAGSPSTLIRKLIAGRARFAFHNDLGLKSIIKDKNLEKKIRIIPVSFLKFYHFAAFSKKIPLNIKDKVRKALKEIADNGELVRIYNKYVLTE